MPRVPRGNFRGGVMSIIVQRATSSKTVVLKFEVREVRLTMGKLVDLRCA